MIHLSIICPALFSFLWKSKKKNKNKKVLLSYIYFQLHWGEGSIQLTNTLSWTFFSKNLWWKRFSDLKIIYSDGYWNLLKNSSVNDRMLNYHRPWIYFSNGSVKFWNYWSFYDRLCIICGVSIRGHSFFLFQNSYLIREVISFFATPINLFASIEEFSIVSEWTNTPATSYIPSDLSSEKPLFPIIKENCCQFFIP